jgi:hypothetical protein
MQRLQGLARSPGTPLARGGPTCSALPTWPRSSIMPSTWHHMGESGSPVLWRRAVSVAALPITYMPCLALLSSTLALLVILRKPMLPAGLLRTSDRMMTRFSSPCAEGVSRE